MLLNNAISIISNGRLALGDLALAIAENIQKGLDNTEDQAELRRRLVLTYACLKVLDPIVVISGSSISYILDDYSDTKINRILLFLRDISKSGNLPVVSKILNPISTSLVGQGPAGPAGAAGANAFLYVGYADDSSGTGYSTAPAGKTFVAFKQSNVAISPVTAATFTGLWRQFVGDPGAPGTNGSDGQSQYLFQAWADADDGTGFTLTFNASKDYTAFLVKSDATPPVQADFTGLWAKYIGDDGAAGATGSAGADGDDAYVYIAYADADDGTGFTLTFDVNKDYIAILSTDTELSPPIQADFAGLWKNYKGATGAGGSNGTDGADAYLYIAYASDINGTDFTTVFDQDKEFIAFLQSDTEITDLTASNFTGLWRRYKGDGDRYKTTSSTSMTIGTGNKFFNVGTGLSYITAQRVLIVVPGDPNTYMIGPCVFYDAEDGQMQVNVDTIAGSGTYSTWDVNLVAAPATLANQDAYFATLATDQGSGGTPQALSGSPTKITQFDTVVSQSDGMTASIVNGDITVDNNGAYVVDFNARVSGPTSANVLFQLYIGGVAVPNMIDDVPFGGSTSQEFVSIHAILSNIQQADVFDIRATASTGTPNLLVEQGRFNVYTVGFLNTEQFKDFENPDVDTGTETVDSFTATAGNAAKFEVLILKGTNFKSSTVLAVWDGTNPPEVSEVGPIVIGTIDVTLTVDFSGGDIRLRATATSDDWIVRGKRTIVG